VRIEVLSVGDGPHRIRRSRGLFSR
jgi:hypothetical protein